MTENTTLTKDCESILYGIWFNRKVLGIETNEVQKTEIRKTLEMWIGQADKKNISFNLQNKALHGGEQRLSWSDDVLPGIRLLAA